MVADCSQNEKMEEMMSVMVMPGAMVMLLAMTMDHSDDDTEDDRDAKSSSSPSRTVLVMITCNDAIQHPINHSQPLGEQVDGTFANH